MQTVFCRPSVFAFVICYFLVGSSNIILGESHLTLADAIRKNLVRISIQGAKPDSTFTGEFSSHYGPCMSIRISNMGNESLQLMLETGYLLVPEDSSLQTMIVTKTLFTRILPKQQKDYPLYAMCTEASDAAPSPGKRFNLGKRATSNLLDLSVFINRKSYQTNAAQNAVWCFTDNYDLWSITSEDTTMMYDLRRFVAKAKGWEMNTAYNSNSLATPIQTYASRIVYSGSLSYSLNRTTKIMIALFDENNRIRRLYVNNELQTEGEYTYNYELNSDEMENKKHFLRMFREGKLEQEISILPQN